MIISSEIDGEIILAGVPREPGKWLTGRLLGRLPHGSRKKERPRPLIPMLAASSLPPNDAEGLKYDEGAAAREAEAAL